MGRELFADHNPYADRLVRNAAFIPLIRRVQNDGDIRTSDLARSVGLTSSFLYKLFSGTRVITEEHVQSLFLSLNINRNRAYLAVVDLGNWRRYFDPNVIIVAELVQVLIPDLHEKRGTLEAAILPPATIRYISRQLTSAILQNDSEVAERREKIAIMAARG